MYSQEYEEQWILHYFHKKEGGVLLDIGANDGKTLSNSRALIEAGWHALLVEPAKVYSKLEELYRDNDLIQTLNVAISTAPGATTLYESGPLYSNDDSALLSSLIEPELNPFAPVGMHWREEIVTALDFSNLLQQSKYKHFDFVTIDAEGMDWNILRQMDLTQLGVQCLCIEHNQDPVTMQLMMKYCEEYSLKIFKITTENLIFTK